MQYESFVTVGKQRVSLNDPTFFIADIASNHDGDLSRAIDLIYRAKRAGADAAKFQHFRAKDIVSDRGFRSLGQQLGHQTNWKKSVYDIFEQYELNREWDRALYTACEDAKIHFMTSPYDFDAVRTVADLVAAFKIGSGDITWIEMVKCIASQKKPVFLACGASTLEDVERALNALCAHTTSVALMQCNTNYSGDYGNFNCINLRVLQAFSLYWPNMVLGLSDHTLGHATVLGAVALGARVIEKHFTDDNSRDGPDHGFAMNPVTWAEMVQRTRELELSLGDGIKRIEANELDTVILQRRCLRAARALPKGHIIKPDDLRPLRPAPADAVMPYDLGLIVGRPLAMPKKEGEALLHSDFASEVEQKIC